ncbi:hypothetical protein [Taklimakanibacter deserti]|uniref:hypothetical protein n=1 Tax=Taklimakanibacter deserti TaxID=2267839 RepID=UPI000E65BF98
MASSSRPAIAEATPKGTGGVLHACTRAGHDLPIIDVTHPRFAVADDEAARAARSRAFLSDDRQRGWIPPFLLRFLLRRLARKSRLAAAMFNPISTGSAPM